MRSLSAARCHSGTAFPSRTISRAFTLIELLVMVSIIGLLVGLLVPALSAALSRARASACKLNLKNLGTGLVTYQSGNNDFVVPSYNMKGTTGGSDVPLDGWASILHRDGVVPGSRTNANNIFACPSMLDIEGMKSGQTGTDPSNPKGWMEWPNLRMGTQNISTTIPQRGFNEVIRVGYWINADNPIGGSSEVIPDLFYTSSVGYGPGSNGRTMRLTRASAFTVPSCLIVLADGVYAGRQRDNRLGTANSRIGYRHAGGVGAANAVFADGHVAAVEGDKFPRGQGGSASLADLRADNLGSLTGYANPAQALK